MSGRIEATTAIVAVALIGGVVGLAFAPVSAAAVGAAGTLGIVLVAFMKQVYRANTHQRAEDKPIPEAPITKPDVTK